MVILPATEADLQAVIELVAQGRAALAVRASTQWQDGYPSPETVRRDLLRGDGRIVRIDGAAAGLRRLRLRRANRLRPDRGGRLGRRRALCGGAPAGRGRALRAAGSCRRVAARSRREALVRGIRSFRHRHAPRQRAHACAAREGGARPVGARCATKPCGWLTRSRSSADPLRYVTASGDGCRNIRADDLNQGGYIPFCTAASPKRALPEAPPGAGPICKRGFAPRMLRQSVVCSSSENRRGAELYIAA